ncbi:hypothetical protein [Mucilaginibacter sp. UR6-11]|uniref:hypothetical protein n=1 Tax=Mucilaginibacter sp. UR6-11 TaxID=1435644 RepID=UPI001E3B9BF0|nr:hypothetical protein [Mucilaginibacter sp. UR6-11]MCC8424674.1 hypothetical protein [Mucilaginibacter sp. UR6-11]
MIQAHINSQTYFFTVNHITREDEHQLIYGIRLNNTNYLLRKTSGISDAVQADNHTPLADNIMQELNDVITAVEIKHKKRLSLANINKEIFSILVRLRSMGINKFTTSLI